LALEGGGQLFAFLEVSLNLLSVVMIIGEGGIDVREGELGVMRDDLIR
jgi:hypothetical protein